MDWVVDTCILLDILDEMPPFAEAAAEALDEKAEEGELTVAPITYVELSPAFNGDRSMQDLFLRNVGVDIDFGGNAPQSLPRIKLGTSTFCANVPAGGRNVLSPM